MHQFLSIDLVKPKSPVEEKTMSESNAKILMVHSYKGGTGKTAIAVNLARYLAIQKKKKVLLIEQDVSGSSFKNIFRVSPKRTWNDFYQENLPIKDLITSVDKFDIICAKAQEIEIPAGQNPRTYHARQLERLNLQKKWLLNNYDFVILDTRPGYTIELINSIMISDIAILMSRIDVDTVENTISMYDQIYSQFASKEIIIVQNQIPVPPQDGVKTSKDIDIGKIEKIWLDFIKDKTLISIPLKNEIAYPLSRSKIAAFNNPLMEYIEEIASLIL